MANSSSFENLFRVAGGPTTPISGPLLLTAAVIIMMLVLMVPLPPLLLDFFFSISIAASLVVLIMTIFIDKSVDLSAFPTILLLVTTFRLALNVASTRLILTEGHNGVAAAGHVIEAFGHFVMRGNVVVGLIIFSVLMIINFIVITKGAGRIAEVAARFTLDAMPGKQMAIDADLSAGLLSESQARERRRMLEEENSFFAAMDGASKFVKGDAIAAIIIILINIVGGLLIGTLDKGMSFKQAFDTYTLLSVGDGLVAQMPGILVSTAAGLIVTKAGMSESTDKVLTRQLAAHPSAFVITGMLLLGIALVPGIPFIPFAFLAAALYALAVLSGRLPGKIAGAATGGALALAGGRPLDALPAPAGTSGSEAGPTGAVDLRDDLRIDEMRLSLGVNLLPMLQETSTGSIVEAIRNLRRTVAREYGFILPAIRVVDDIELQDSGYAIYLKEQRIGQGEVRPGSLLALNPMGGEVELPGAETVDPAFGIPARWIDVGLKRTAEQRSYTVVDITTVISTHLGELIKRHMSALVSYGATQGLVDRLAEESPRLVQAVIPSIISITGIQAILRGLLAERVSVRNLADIIEAAAEWAPRSKDPADLLENVRFQIRRQITYQLLDEETRTLNIAVMSNLNRNGEPLADHQLRAPAARDLANLLSGLAEIERQMAQMGQSFVVVAPERLRQHLADLLKRQRKFVPVLSQREIDDTVDVNVVGRLSWT
jgi:flagellar biosynthesis protein FlhA